MVSRSHSTNIDTMHIGEQSVKKHLILYLLSIQYVVIQSEFKNVIAANNIGTAEWNHRPGLLLPESSASQSSPAKYLMLFPQCGSVAIPNLDRDLRSNANLSRRWVTWTCC